MSDFYARKTVEELAREQAVTPGSLDEWLASREPWPEGEDEEDFDAFLAEIRGRPRPAQTKEAS